MQRISVSVLVLLWLALLVPIVFLASVPTSIIAQGLMALCICVLIYVLKPFVSASMPVRFFVLAVAAVFVLRYWLWRLLETLPALDDPVSLAAALVLFGAETFTVGLFFLTALVSGDPVDHAPPPKVKLRDAPTVDILIPSYNEPADLLAVTLAAAKNVTYPDDKKVVVLCDDGGTDQRCAHSDPEVAREARERRAELQELCRELGVVYTTRARNEHAKAGNLNEALKSLKGELVLVLDADHVPTRDFLARTVGYFAENPRLFLVQTPHFFTNRDPIERNLAFSEALPSENEMFYGQIHRGLDRLGGAFFCGSAALLRRRALDEVGGISGETITEDAETALDIHSRGWESMYLDYAMIAGLQPETFASFIQQRGRWATGMIQMLILKNPIFRSGLPFTKRLCYLNSMSFWLFPVVRMIFLLSPLLYLFFGLEIFVVTPAEVLGFILPYLLIGFMVQNALFSHVRWPQVSEVYEIAQTPYLLGAIISTIRKPRAASFKVTAKDESLDRAFMSPIAMPLLALTGLLLAGLVAGVLRWVAYPGDRAVVQIVGAWNVYNFILAAWALRSVFERPWRLVRPRTAVSVPARLTISWPENAAEGEATPDTDSDTGEGVEVVIVSATPKSLSVRLPAGAEGDIVKRASDAGASASILPAVENAPAPEGPLPVTVGVLKSDTSGYLCMLDIPESAMIDASRFAAAVVYGDSGRWEFFRKTVPRSSTLVTGFAYVIGKALMSLPVTVLDLLREPERRRQAVFDDAAEIPRDAFAAAKGTEARNRPAAEDDDEDGYLEVEG
ncbi:MAG: cellulose synthase catalytic subunit (UDP-forming) [Rhodobacteraceae bacterium]|mgnify:CR=1 FL=1|jgi:cellulose synthase (UDP-forming)|uniref:Cellulose synthase catalytic subunit [UDP-forming] n=1 Tax=Salipiger profundus TaxID=1229727 RepID=A0A1U7D471_9RHOB|nr:MULTISPECIES: UDP-forming cellulose synthase catalytic subunit [Salipiger]APX22903.1 cellulose synthase (UDP-forming) [Salipiger profundus]MAB07987.1 cellulose synthase catalytic subunit (UDP-forming) [Paracoccaceae bacterium]GGA11974.1 cellulose synthase catalytic subunit (UDP-forming) [Salipiger profundus]SFD24164.1 cellulose synthase (UDP-forming) [Salipiger profundus]